MQSFTYIDVIKVSDGDFKFSVFQIFFEFAPDLVVINFIQLRDNFECNVVKDNFDDSGHRCSDQH